jgi:uncharacterized protein YndB with AHSA1/START domain
MDSDRIQKKIVLKAARARVWAAISDSARFGTWFGAEFDGPFVAGQEIVGRIVPTQVDADVARMQEPYRGIPWRVVVERMEPMTLFSFRWHPGAADPNHDYTGEPMTLVTFELSDAEGGTLLTITESGFDRIPLARRMEAMKGNDEGWTHQARLIEKYLALQATP